MVNEMTSIQITESGVILGASVTLSTMERVLRDQIKNQPGKVV